ncbi:MAG: D-alanyl-D-alanine carboxypeptidase/D-alanyl-D-alanine-endopeptidase, partial [Pyrinomonadaceae bacterium]
MSSKKNRASISLSLVLLLSLLHVATPARAQDLQTRQQRERTVNPPVPAQTPTTTPVQRPTPAQTATTPARNSSAVTRTLEELRARIAEITGRAEFAPAHIGVKVASLDTGRVLYEEGAGKWMQPASNMKLYTVAAALDRFGPDYRFVTSVYAPARPDRMGTVRGDLIVYGRGDPTYATRFNPDAPDDYYHGIDELATRIASAGVRRVEGDLVGDESYLDGSPVAPGWEWDDLQWWYGAELSALTVNDNSVDLTVKPGARVGEPCRITVGPATPLVTIVDRTTTTPAGTVRELTVHRPLGQNVIEISGGMPVDDRGYTASVAVSRPAMLFASMLRASLE